MQESKFPKFCQRLVKNALDTLGFGFILIATPALYVHGIFILIPEVIGSTNNILLLEMAYILATWFFVCVLCNLYLVRRRHSSIRGRILQQPLLATAESVNDPNWPGLQGCNNGEGLNHRSTSINLTLGQQFMAKPFGSQDAWHICAVCEIYVPNNCWHCSKSCNTCIMRRDHHCHFAMTCIGEDNHSNFLGLLLYLFLGTCYASTLSTIYAWHVESSIWWFIFKTMIPSIFLPMDFSIGGLLASVATIGTIISGFIFAYYLSEALTGLTTYDRKHNRSLKATHSYQKLKMLLGPSPIKRIIWPFHRIHRTEYDGRQPKSY